MTRPEHPVIDIRTRRPVLLDPAVGDPPRGEPPAASPTITITINHAPLAPRPRALSGIRWYFLLGALAAGIGVWIAIARLAHVVIERLV